MQEIERLTEQMESNAQLQRRAKNAAKEALTEINIRLKKCRDLVRLQDTLNPEHWDTIHTELKEARRLIIGAAALADRQAKPYRHKADV